jgi:hypothetical protein
METILELAKGTLQYAPSYVATLVELLTRPIVFLKKSFDPADQQEALKRAFSFAFLTIVLMAILDLFLTDPQDWLPEFIQNVAIAVVQITGCVVVAHLALKIAGAKPENTPLAAFALYMVSATSIIVYIITTAFESTDLPPIDLLLILVVVMLPFYAICWTAVSQAYKLTFPRGVLSFVAFLILFWAFGWVMWRVTMVI